MSKESHVVQNVPLELEVVLSYVSHLQGEVLTIIEASSIDSSRLKATKDLVKASFHRHSDWIVAKAIPSLPMVSVESLEAEGLDTEKIAAEAETLE